MIILANIFPNTVQIICILSRDSILKTDNDVGFLSVNLPVNHVVVGLLSKRMHMTSINFFPLRTTGYRLSFYNLTGVTHYSDGKTQRGR